MPRLRACVVWALGGLLFATVCSAAPIFTSSFSGLPMGGEWQPFFAGDTLGPWSVTAGSVDLIKDHWPAEDGDHRSIDLNGNDPGTITVSLSSLPEYVPGAHYQVSFWVSANPDALNQLYTTANPISYFRVLTSGGYQDFTIDPNDIDGYHTQVSLGNMHWQYMTFDFIGSLGSEFLTFMSLDPAHDMWGVALDNISVTQVVVPEPGTWILLGGGLLALALYRRKR
jgi:hypothetical protein